MVWGLSSYKWVVKCTPNFMLLLRQLLRPRSLGKVVDGLTICFPQVVGQVRDFKAGAHYNHLCFVVVLCQ